MRNAPIRWGLTGTIPEKERFEFESIHASIGLSLDKSVQKNYKIKECLSQQGRKHSTDLIDTASTQGLISIELAISVTNKDSRLEYIGNCLLNKAKSNR